jgi:hypothetical protein
MSAEVDALRALLEAQKAIVEPELAGNISMANDALPQDALQAIGTQIQAEQNYLGTINAALDALNALDGGNFPNPPVMSVTQAILDAINKDKSNVEAGAGTFVLQSTASTAQVSATVFDKP